MKTKEEFNLSEKRTTWIAHGVSCYREEDVKEAVRLLKLYFYEHGYPEGDNMFEEDINTINKEIDSIFGEKLK